MIRNILAKFILLAKQDIIWIRRQIKISLCKHYDIKWERNIYGDEINYSGGNRSLWRCQDCGCGVPKPTLMKEPVDKIKE